MDIYLRKPSRATSGARDSVSTTHKLTVKDGHQVKKLSLFVFLFFKKNMTPLNSQHCKSLHFTVKLCRKNLNVRKCLIPQDVRQYSRPR